MIVQSEIIDAEGVKKMRYTLDDGSQTVEDLIQVAAYPEPTQNDRIEANLGYLVLMAE